jgi:GT2 family glycosyltransferase/glycosyltransferase involved in cell wall biosynthesis
LTLACLRSLAENHSERLEIIIVDNNSQDETSLLLDRLRGPRIIRNPENRNFLLAVNQGARDASGEYLLMLNNDAQVLPGTLRSTLNTIRRAPDIGGVGGRLILLDGTLQEAGSIIWRDGSCVGYGRGDNPFAPMYMFRRDVDYCSGAFLLTPRRVWEELGGFDERFKPAYYEETDYCTRLWERHLRVVYDPNSILLHYEFASSESVNHATDLQRDHQRIFAARHQQLLATHFAPDLNSIVQARMKDRGNSRVLFVDDRVPHAWLGSGFPRARAILIAMLKQGCVATFYPLTEFAEDWISVYSDVPPEIEVMIGYGPPLLETFLRNRKSYYNTIFVSRPHNMQILKPILDTHPDWFEETNIIYDAEAIFATREVTFRTLNGASVNSEEADALVAEEVGLASAADCIVAVSERDAGQFRKHGIENVHVIGHALAPSPTARGFDERSGFLFVGAIHDEVSPNGDSVIWFLEEIFPRIQTELGRDVVVTIAGVNKSDRVKSLAGPSVNVTGHLPDLAALYDSARVFVAPTRYAAGISHKVHEAAARGLPVVATPLIASQLGWDDGNCVLIGSDAQAFAARCIQLYRDADLWMKLRHAALERITRECSTETFERNVTASLRMRVHCRGGL